MCFAEFMEVVEVKEVMEVILHIEHYLYVATQTFNFHHWLDSSFSSTLASQLGGPRGPWIDPRRRCNCRRCRRRESLQKLSVFFHKLRFMEVVEVMEVVLWRLWRS